MADIGIRLAAEGDADFKRALAEANAAVRTLESEIRLTTATFENNADSQEALTKRQRILTAETDAQRKKIELLTKRMAECSEACGEDAAKTKNWERKLNDAKTELIRMERSLDETTGALKNFGEEADDAADETDDLSGRLDALTVMAGNLAANGVSWLAGKVGDAAAALWNMDEATAESREKLALVATAYETAGLQSDAAGEAVKGFYRILGDQDEAAKAAQLLASIAEQQEDIAKWTEVAAGVYGMFGDAIPIDSLMEAANETEKTGKLTGALADAVNWAGGSEEELQTALDSCSSAEERQQVILTALIDLYGDASDAFYDNNEDLIKNRDAILAVEEANDRLGESMEHLKSALATKYMPVINNAKTAIANVIEAAAGVMDATDATRRADAAGVGDAYRQAVNDAYDPDIPASQRYQNKAAIADALINNGIYKSNGKIYTADWYQGSGSGSVNTKAATYKVNEAAVAAEAGVYLDGVKVGRALSMLDTKRILME